MGVYLDMVKASPDGSTHKPRRVNKINDFLLQFTPFQKQKIRSIEDFLSFKHRRQLIDERKNYSRYATHLNFLGIILTLLIAEKQIQDGLSFIDDDVTEEVKICSTLKMNQSYKNYSKMFLSKLNRSDIDYQEFYWSWCLNNVYDPGLVVKLASVVLSLTTIALIYFTLLYHKVEYAIFKFDNSIAPDLAYIKKDKICKLLFEILILAMHPISYLRMVNFYSFPGLYFVVLLRAFFLDRLFILNSEMYSNTTTETVATLNQINFGALSKESSRLIFRNYMTQYPGKIMTVLVASNWVLMAWCIRLTEARHYLRSGQIIDCQFNFVDTAWMFPITFTTIGYGDVYPKSPYGRLFAMWIGGSGIIASAILVGLTTDKLTMTRREKLINKVLYNENLNNELKNKAAIVIQRTYRRHKAGYSILQNYADDNPACLFSKRSVPLIRTVFVLKAITAFKKLRIQRKYLDNDNIDMVDVGLKTLDIQTDVARLNCRMDRMESKMDQILGKLERL